MQPRSTRTVALYSCLIATLIVAQWPLVGRAADEPAQAASPDSSPRAFDRLRDAYLPLVNPDDPLAFPMKVRALSRSLAGMWGGGKDLFYQWCKKNAGEWMDDRDSFVTQEGDQHLGNVGTYLTPGERFGTIAFGMVDYDETARLPFQLELLQGLISLELSASSAGVELSDHDIEQLTTVLMEEYRNAAASSRTATEMLRGDSMVKQLLATRDKVAYGKELRSFLADDQHFVPARVNKKGEIKDILRPADGLADAMAQGISDALARDLPAARLFRATDTASIRQQIRAVALRTRTGSGGSQGLKKYFVLLNRPIVGMDADVILYIKQQVPSAAERAGLIPPDPRPPGQRAAEDSRAIDHPPPLLSSWCEIGKESYWIAFREPWTKELPDELHSVDDVFQTARVWAVAAGASHHEPGQAKMIADRTTPQLGEKLQELSKAYQKQVRADYADFVADPRVKDLRAKAEEAIKAATTNAAVEE